MYQRNLISQKPLTKHTHTLLNPQKPPNHNSRRTNRIRICIRVPSQRTLIIKLRIKECRNGNNKLYVTPLVSLLFSLPFHSPLSLSLRGKRGGREGKLT